MTTADAVAQEKPLERHEDEDAWISIRAMDLDCQYGERHEGTALGTSPDWMLRALRIILIQNENIRKRLKAMEDASQSSSVQPGTGQG